MGLQTGFLDELVALTADPTGIGYAANEALNSIVNRLSQHINSPLKLYATGGTPDARLNFGPQVITLGDGALANVGPISSLIPSPSSPLGTLNFQTGAVTGITLQFKGSAFAIPSSTSGKFRRFVFCLRSTGAVNCNYGNEQTTQAALENPGTLASAIDGQLVGWVDCVATATSNPGAYKSATAATSIIQNADISRVRGGGGSGSAAGGGGSMQWFQVDGANPPPQLAEYGGVVYQFQPLSNGTQTLQADMWVPASFVAGQQITMQAAFYSPGVSSGTNVPQVQVYLVRPGVDSLASIPNSQTFTASLTVPATAAVPQYATLALTDSSGLINGVAVTGGSLLRILLTRASDTDPNDYRFLPDSTGVIL